MSLDEKIEKVKSVIKNKKIIVAFSGGADSTLIAYLSKKVSKDTVAITIDNGLMPSNFLKDSSKIAKEIGIEQITISQNYLENKKFKENSSKRCFICRNLMYSKIKEIAIEKGYDAIIDGTNISDLLEDRPGIMVNYENNILSPLVIAGIEKNEVIEYLHNNNINYLKSTSCLATRIKNNTTLTSKKLNRIKYGENLLKSITKSDIVRIRDYNDNAHIEIDNIESLLNKNTLNLIVSELKSIGFKNVYLNIESKFSKQQDIVIYKPCKDEANKIMFENELPYTIDISSTCKELEKVGTVKCSDKMGVAMLEIDEKNITLFKNGKIVARKIEDKKDAQETLIKVLPLIRRDI
ncbi:ATP-dependent sacrificial sulfur transferase LarE [Methanobrevibacter filiformis]|uniref:7-cyano-7-deazaguanine synthase n=1 Tax=Methanobrevibacter filiformis TaxID=55758 RepID=A0A166A9Z1_9EURY|nr:ATP-dependent sacrificial sulfur transferase LarE [Methanobrevibacter filiformis]KZX11768.1 7-cyano-7-deazaguanine synthase [Methanobrevibacter filiformis]